MLGFTFFNPVRVEFGRGRLAVLDALVPTAGTVLVVFGGGSARSSGVLERVLAELAKSPRRVLEFGGITANPAYDTVMRAVELVRSEGVDFILAVGGGSVMDGAKFIALAAHAKTYQGREHALLGTFAEDVDSALPLGVVPTLPATGSEMNCFAVISHGADKLPVKTPLLFPRFAILDPELTFSLPSRQVANGIVDTFVHAVEQYVTYPVDARLQDRMAEGIVRTVVEVGPRTLSDPTDYDARANLVWCAAMGLNGLIGAGVPQDWVTHKIGHELTALFGVDHARSLAAVLPGVWRVRREQKRAKLLQLAERVWGVAEGSEEARVEQAIARTAGFFESLGVATSLTALGIGKADIDTVVAALERHGLTALGERGDVTPIVVREILLNAL